MNECSLCLQNITNEDPIIKFPKCKHVLHSECFIKFLQYEIDHHSKLLTCPLCRDVVINMPEIVVPEPARIEERHIIINNDMENDKTQLKAVFYCFYALIIIGFLFDYHFALTRNP